MPEPGETAKLKVCLLGDEGVGKTSLIRRFVLSEFDERYVRTVGVVVHKRVVLVPTEGAMHEAVLTVWDILGRADFVGRYREAFLANAAGVLAVCDLTRPETLGGLGRWLDRLHAVVKDVPVIVLANKRDLQENVRIEEDEILAFCELYGVPCVETSAKTGENVEMAFGKIAEIGMHEALARRVRPPAKPGGEEAPAPRRIA